MKVAILCGGIGTRLREETEFRPKPMVQIGHKPILWHIMKTYAHYGYNEFVLALGYRGEDIKQYFLNYEAMANDFTIQLGRGRKLTYHSAHSEGGLTVTMVDTGDNTMTGGRLARLSNYVGDDLFMLTYGDGIADIDVNALIAFHRSHGKAATLTTVRPLSRFGILEFGADDRVNSFREKPVSDGWINAGYFVFNRSIFDYLDSDDCVLEREPLQRLAQKGQLFAYRHKGFFYAMDTYREYLHLNQMWDSGTAPWRVWGK